MIRQSHPSAFVHARRFTGVAARLCSEPAPQRGFALRKEFYCHRVCRRRLAGNPVSGPRLSRTQSCSSRTTMATRPRLTARLPRAEDTINEHKTVHNPGARRASRSASKHTLVSLEKRVAATHENWVHAYLYINKFTDGQLRFADINEQFCNEFKEHSFCRPRPGGR